MLDNFLTQVGLQWALDLKVKQEAGDMETNPTMEALTDASIEWETDILDSEKFYEC